MTRADVISFFTALLFAAVATGLVIAAISGVTAFVFVLAILLILFALHYFQPALSIFTVIGLIAGVLIVIVFRQLSPVGLAPVELLVALGLLWLLGRKAADG